jgi:heterodisulfide reductase subunit C
VNAVANPRLLRSLASAGSFDAEGCMNCGVCTATCPLGLNLMPRLLFRYVVLGLDDRVVRSRDAIFSCLLCRACEASCPSGVHISENVRELRRWLLTEGS